MFGVKDSDVDRNFLIVSRVIDAALLVALLASFTSAFLTVGEYRLLGRTLIGDESLTDGEMRALQNWIILQLATDCIAAISLTLGLAATLWLRRRYSSSQQSLRQVKLLTRNILTSTDRGVLTIDRLGIVTSINSAASSLLRTERSDRECVGLPLEKVAPSEIPLVEVFRRINDRQQPVRDREVVLVRDGRRQRLQLDGDVLKDTHGTPLGCVLHLEDTTERMLLEERMRRMERFIALSTLASGLHHEIKNPLTALSIHVQLLEEGLGKPGAADTSGELVGVLKTEVTRLNGVLENFRSFAHLQRLSIQPIDALGVVEDVIRLIGPQAAQQQVRIAVLHSGTQRPTVPLDPDKFEQAVLNLVINALEAMPNGGNLTITTATHDGEFRVSVQDTGPGIPPEVQTNLFQPYFSTKDGGTGMGLALSEKLISQHGGRIDFLTGPGGTTFRISVPMTQPNGQPHE